MKEFSSKPLGKDALNELRGGSARERLLHRLHSVALVLRGYSASEAARIYADSPRAVAYWVKRFKRDGIKGLHEEARPGRPATLTGIQSKQLQLFIKRSGREGKPVNAEAIATHLLKEHGVSLTHRQCWRILKKYRT